MRIFRYLLLVIATCSFSRESRTNLEKSCLFVSSVVLTSSLLQVHTNEESLNWTLEV